MTHTLTPAESDCLCFECETLIAEGDLIGSVEYLGVSVPVCGACAKGEEG